MAECVVARCVQERRFFKRELQKWGKNVLYLVGLERVAQEVIGHRRWQKLTHRSFGADLEVPEAVDWTPDSKCYFCNKEKRLTRGHSKRVHNSADGASGEELVTEGASGPDSPSSVVSDQPLDLSMGGKTRPHSPSTYNGDADGSSFLKVPRLPDKSGKLKRRSDVIVSAIPLGVSAAAACKRSYTDDELQAALRDIHSGKLGTRRAAVLYGIPRSTLRNKVYKMSMASAAGTSRTKGGGGGVVPSLTMEELVGDDDDAISASDSLKRLLRNRVAERLQTKKSLAASSRKEEENSSVNPFISHVLSNVQQLALSKRSGRKGDSSSSCSTELKLPLLPDLIRKLSEERFEEECSRHRDTAADSVILKIPSYKPVRPTTHDDTGASSQQQSGSSNGTKKGVIGVTLREIIAKSIGHRFDVDGGGVDNNKEITVVEVTSNGADTHCRLSRERRPSKRTAEASIRSPNEDSKTGSKRARPKRGRYRNYDRDNLMEAVRAVQRGEMSVHRAGSYYGVPHSTLEYKVKERHLLRPRKRRSGGGGKSTKKHREASSSSVAASSVSNSCSSSDDDNSVSAPPSTDKTASDLQEEVAATDAVVDDTAPAPTSSLWPFSLDLTRLNSNNFFASQMMRKLQEDALTQTTHDADGLGGRDALLLNVLIRNGLQIQATEVSGTK